MLFALGYGGRINYGGDDVKKDTTVRPLDPIHCAGSFSKDKQLLLLRRLRLIGLTVLITALLFIGDENVAKCYVLEQKRLGQRSLVITQPRYKGHLDELKEAGMLAPACLEFALFISSYFEVDKGDASRAIFNGKRVSRLFRTPPVVNIPDIPTFLKKCHDYSREFNTHNVVQGDLRHWFHQIEINSFLQRMFAIATGKDNVMLWRNLPMGFSYSCWIAQSIAWGLLAFRIGNEKPLLDENAFRGEHLPMFVDVLDESGYVCGFCSVYYDNYFADIADEKVATVFYNRIKRNALDLGIKIKGESAEDRTEGIDITHKITRNKEMHRSGVVHLGVQLRLRCIRDREGELMSTLEHRLGRVEKWQTAHEWKNPVTNKSALQKPRTYRGMAEITGKLMFYWLIHLRPLCTIPEARALINIVRRIGKGAYANGWDGECNISCSDWTIITNQWKLVTENDWLSRRSVEKSSDWMVIATDSSSTSYGTVYMFQDGSTRTYSGKWAENDADQRMLLPMGSVLASDHIFLKELRVACDAIISFFGEYPEEKGLRLLCDNSGVVWSLRNGFCTNNRGQTMIESLGELLCKIEVISCVSKNNVADCPSRAHEKNAFDDFEYRLKQSWKTVNEHAEGRKHGVAGEYTGDVEDRTEFRHDAPPSEFCTDIDLELSFLHSDFSVSRL